MTKREAESRALWWIQFLHTVAWAVFASAIVAIPVVALLNLMRAAAWLSALVWLEVLILMVNRMRCPLTGVAARFTSNRADNFDIFLPLWLARNNKLLFGSLFVVGETILVWKWVLARG